MQIEIQNYIGYKFISRSYYNLRQRFEHEVYTLPFSFSKNPLLTADYWQYRRILTSSCTHHLINISFFTPTIHHSLCLSFQA